GIENWTRTIIDYNCDCENEQPRRDGAAKPTKHFRSQNSRDDWHEQQQQRQMKTGIPNLPSQQRAEQDRPRGRKPQREQRHSISPRADNSNHRRHTDQSHLPGTRSETVENEKLVRRLKACVNGGRPVLECSPVFRIRLERIPLTETCETPPPARAVCEPIIEPNRP